MLKIRFLFTALLFTATVHAQKTSTQEQITIQQTIENLFAALTDADTTAMKKFTSNTVRFYEYGEVWTMDTLIHKVLQTKSIPGFRRTNKFEFVNTTINRKTAWATYCLQSTFTRNGKEEIVNWMETVILIKNKKNWEINVLHSTRLIKK